MRLIITLFLSLLLTISLFGQDCTDPNCKTIYELMGNISSLNKTIEDERVSARSTFQSLQSERRKNNQNTQEINRLNEIFSSQQERINQLISDLNRKQRELNDIVEYIKTIDNKTRDLQKLVDDYEAEKAVYEDDIAIKKAKDLENLVFMNTFIRDVELGYEDDGKIIVHKIYDGERVDFSNKRTFKKSLNKVNVKGDYYISVQSNQSPENEITVKMLLYIDNKLHEVVTNSLEYIRDDAYETIAHYKIRYQVGNTLDNPIPEKSGMVRVAFIETNKYQTINQDELTGFWEACNKGHFLLSNVEPKFPNVKLTDNETIKNAVRVSSYTSNSDNLTLEVSDYGIFDGDQASFYLNGEPIVTYLKLGKKDNPYTLNISLRQGKNNLAIFANSTGSTEPCTASVVIKNGGTIVKRCRLAAKVGYCEKLEIIR